MKKAYYKLVRDRIPEILNNLGKTAVYREMEDEEYGRTLLYKLKEETDEVLRSSSEPENVMKEIGDVYEVLESIAEYYGLSEEAIKKVKEIKRTERGGFKKKIFLETADE